MPRKAKEPKRRIRSPHPGVKLVRKQRSDGKDTHYARFFDPELGKVTQVNLSVLGLTTIEARRDWAITKSKALSRREAEIQATGFVRTETTLAAAVKLYVDHRAPEVSAATHKAYADAARDFSAWAGTHGIALAESITPAHLLDYRTWFLNRPKRAQASGEGIGRGSRKEVKAKRAPVTVNKALRSLKTILNYWRQRGITPKLDGDAIRDSLKPVKGLKTIPHFLKAKDCRALLEAAMRHDAETFTITRAENAGDGTPGTTPRYAPIAPFIAAGLLTGCRWHELSELRWADVDLDAGEITLQAERTKTRASRRITLAETPALAALLAALKLRAGNGEYVWGKQPYGHDLAESARKRLVDDYAAPPFTWLDLRHTCGTFLTCAPSIYGAASAFLAAKRAGHSVTVSEKFYVRAVKISPEHKTLEAALGIESEVAAMIGEQAGATLQPVRASA